MTGNFTQSIMIEKELHFERGWSFHRKMEHCTVIMGYDNEQSTKNNYEKGSIEHWNDSQILYFDVHSSMYRVDMSENSYMYIQFPHKATIWCTITQPYIP